MRILITGGNGYVGRTLTRRLYSDHAVTVVDNLRDKKIRFLDEELPRFTLIESDITDFEVLLNVFDHVKPDVVVHLAAIHYIPECELQPGQAMAVNTLGTANVMRACLPGTRVVFASTAAVYAAEDHPHNEDSSPLDPNDVYGLTKLHAEQYVSHWTRRSDLRTTIVRLFNVVGPGETNPHLVPAILAQALQGQQVLRLGNCFPKRDYVHVEDAAEAFAIVALSQAKNAGNPDIVNVGTGHSYSVLEVVQKLSRITGINLDIEMDPARLRRTDRPFVQAGTQKMLVSYGWSAKRSLDDSLADLWCNPDLPELLISRRQT